MIVEIFRMLWAAFSPEESFTKHRQRPEESFTEHQQRPEESFTKHQQQPKESFTKHQQQPKESFTKHQQQPKESSTKHQQRPKESFTKHRRRPRDNNRRKRAVDPDCASWFSILETLIPKDFGGREGFNLSEHSYVTSYKAPDRSSTSSFRLKEYFIEGRVNGTPIEALPDSGANLSFISPGLASDLGLSYSGAIKKRVSLANGKTVLSPGMVKVPWTFAANKESHMLDCWILPGCVHDLILGNSFLRATKTFTRFHHRIKSKFVQFSRRPRVQLIGEGNQRLIGWLDGHFTAALPDTGSDVMLISRAYAEKLGLNIDRDAKNRLELELADGTVQWTSGVVRDVLWSAAKKIVRCDFHVLDDLCVDLVLSKDYVFDMNVFPEYENCLVDITSKDLSELYNIRLIGRYSDNLNFLEEEYLEDLTYPDAFGPRMVQRELARRDHIRDEILLLPEDQREEAANAETERQRGWQALKQANRIRWEQESSAREGSDRRRSEHRTEVYGGRIRAAESSPSEEAVGERHHVPPTRRSRWTKMLGVSIPLQVFKRRRPENSGGE